MAYQICARCAGKGRIECRVCKGKGKVIIRNGNHNQKTFICSECGGTGKKICLLCNGIGYIHNIH